ncbi:MULTISPECIES: hypothetical protein [unclassified Streptomyces]|uniref:hypothetical protein n=1 Tax=unclassified Streptomyces TaxID=2593676 RepID=UPI002A754D8A|nr:hypothetical protein [Streptomyces sp. KN37]WPO73608.1 hypothetical protein R9806_24775 [Streptomyces sp. KN37]
MQNSDSRTDSGTSAASQTTARHRPTQDGSAPPRDAGPCDDECCDLVTVPARQGLEAVDILRRGAGDTIGPVLHDGSCDTLGFLVPPGTADGWDLPGSACTQTSGRGARLVPEPDPGPAVPEPPVAGTGWLLPPGGETDPVTDPAVLRAALGQAARTIEAADNCR